MDDVLLSGTRQSRASNSLCCYGELHSEEGFFLFRGGRRRWFLLSPFTLPLFDEELNHERPSRIIPLHGHLLPLPIYGPSGQWHANPCLSHLLTHSRPHRSVGVVLYLPYHVLP